MMQGPCKIEEIRDVIHSMHLLDLLWTSGAARPDVSRLRVRGFEQVGLPGCLAPCTRPVLAVDRVTPPLGRIDVPAFKFLGTLHLFSLWDDNHESRLRMFRSRDIVLSPTKCRVLSFFPDRESHSFSLFEGALEIFGTHCTTGEL